MAPIGHSRMNGQLLRLAREKPGFCLADQEHDALKGRCTDKNHAHTRKTRFLNGWLNSYMKGEFVMIYSDAELEQMLADLESDLVERKKTFREDAPTAVREAVCAFANDLPNHRRPGVDFIGARDDGIPAGLTITDDLLRQLADVKTDGNIVPPPTLSVAKQQLKGVEVAIITVLPADSPPVRYRGRVWIRIGPRRGIASAQDERILNEKRRFRDRPFDVQPVMSATLDDLDQVRFEVVTQHAVRLDRPAKAYNRWMARIPEAYRAAVLQEDAPSPASIDADLHCMAMVRHYRSLIPLAQEARKPMFFLKPADGALGGRAAAVQDCYRDFRTLAQRIAQRCEVQLP